MAKSSVERDLSAVGAFGRMSEPRATDAKYNARTKRLVLDLDNGIGLTVPVQMMEGLESGSSSQLRAVEVIGEGTVLWWEDLDVQVYVPALVQGILGTASWMAELGRAGGRARTKRKAVAARENGKKGGRPRKRAVS